MLVSMFVKNAKVYEEFATYLHAIQFFTKLKNIFRLQIAMTSLFFVFDFFLYHQIFKILLLFLKSSFHFFKFEYFFSLLLFEQPTIWIPRILLPCAYHLYETLWRHQIIFSNLANLAEQNENCLYIWMVSSLKLNHNSRCVIVHAWEYFDLFAIVIWFSITNQALQY